jgi:aspartyl-tRNA(Asn)/glutamyl-tRNA(Gln) amidotransferase subunit B
VLRDNPTQLEAYLAGKETLSNWFFGQVMRAAQGKVNPQLLRQELQLQLDEASS